MSSHREAPEISKDPVADNADVYAFVSPDDPSTVTIISNFVPLQGPAGGPNFYEFGDDVLYSIYIDNDGDADAGDRVPVPVHLDAAEPEHVPLQHRADRVADRPELERPADLLGGAVRRRQAAEAAAARPAAGPGRRRPARPSRTARHARGARDEPAVPAVQHRAALDAELRANLAAAGGPDASARARWCSADSGTTRSTSTSASIFDLGDLRPFNRLHLIPLAAATRASTRPRR